MIEWESSWHGEYPYTQPGFQLHNNNPFPQGAVHTKHEPYEASNQQIEEDTAGNDCLEDMRVHAHDDDDSPQIGYENGYDHGGRCGLKNDDDHGVKSVHGDHHDLKNEIENEIQIENGNENGNESVPFL